MSAPYRVAVAILILSGQGSSVALAQDPHHHHPVVAPAASSSALARPFRIGALEAWALRDSETALPVGGARTPWKDPAIANLLVSAGQPADAIRLSNQPLLLRDGDRLVLIDTGAGSTDGAAGRLQAALAAAGARPEEITDILISDYQDDHLGGLLTPHGQPAFPHATIHIPSADWAAMQAYPGDAAFVTAMTPRVRPFAPGSVVAPHITAVPLPGHTESHTGYEIVSGTQTLLYIGDALHSSVLSVAHPEWANSSDLDEAAGIATRRALVDRAAAGGLRLYGPHFAWPGLGRIAKVGQTPVWRPEE